MESTTTQLKGLILAAGRGTRMRPLTHTAAKHLIPLAGKPMLFHVIENLVEAGVVEIAIVVGENGPQIEAEVGDGSALGAKIDYVEQRYPQGLAHAVKVAEDYVGQQPFVVYLGDNILGQGISPFVELFEAERPDALVLLKEVDDPSRFGVAELDDQGQIVRLVEKPEAPRSNRAVVGVYLFDSCVFEAINRIEPSARGELEITDALQEMVAQGRAVRGEILTGWWRDAGVPADVLEANQLMVEQLESCSKGTVEGTCDITGRVAIAEGARVESSTIRGPALIGEDAVVVNSYIGPFTSIGREVVVRNSEIDYSILLDGCQVLNMTERVDGSLIGKNVRLEKNGNRPSAFQAVLGDESEVRL